MFQITLIGVLLIPIGLILAIARPRQLYFLTIFFSVFSATSIVNIGTGQTASGVQAYIYLSSLMIVRFVFDSLIKGRIYIPKNIRRPLYLLFFFGLICTASIFMPLWIDGRLQIMSPILLDMTTTPLRFSSANVTGTIYLWIGICTTALVAQRTCEPKIFYETVRLYLWSCIFISSWGLMQAFLRFTGIPYPSFIFNSSATPSAQGFDTILAESGLQRISSVAVEPSLFATSLLTAVPLLLSAVLARRPFVSRRMDILFLVIVLIALLLSTSSTAYIGAVIILLISFRYLFKAKGLQLRYIVVGISGILMLVMAYLFVPQLRLLSEEVLFSKSAGYSALERAKTIVYAFEYFTQYPLLGVGWASVTSHDAVVMLLSNCGVAGLLAFVMFSASLLNRLRRKIKLIDFKARTSLFSKPSVIFLIVIAVALTIDVFDGFYYVFGHFWIVVGLAVSAPTLIGSEDYLFQKV